MSTAGSSPAALADPAVFAILAEFPKPGGSWARGLPYWHAKGDIGTVID